MLTSDATAVSTTLDHAMPDWDLLLTDARIATLCDDLQDYGVIDGPGAIAVKDGRIVWLGLQSDLPSKRRPNDAPLATVGLRRRSSTVIRI